MTDHPSDSILIAHVHDRPGVLAKIASMFYRRALNIRTLTVGGTQRAGVSKMVVRVAGARAEIERLATAIDNLVDVLAVELANGTALRAQELCLARVAVGEGERRAALLAVAAPFQTTVVDSAADSVVLEMAGTPDAIEHFLAAAAPFGVLDVSRTGTTALPGRASPGAALS